MLCPILITKRIKNEFEHGLIVVAPRFGAIFVNVDPEAWESFIIRDIVDLRVWWIKLLANDRLVVFWIEEAGPDLDACYYTDNDAHA